MDFDQLVEKISKNLNLQETSDQTTSNCSDESIEEIEEDLSAKLRRLQPNKSKKSELSAKSKNNPNKKEKLSKIPRLVIFPKEKLQFGLTSTLENKNALTPSDYLQISKLMANQIIEFGE
jgi:hypothetical protein